MSEWKGWVWGFLQAGYHVALCVRKRNVIHYTCQIRTVFHSDNTFVGQRSLRPFTYMSTNFLFSSSIYLLYTLR